MGDTDDSALARRLERATWPVRRFALGEEPDDDLDALTPTERVALVDTLTLRAWAVAGRRVRRIARSKWPGRIRRGA